MAGSSEPLQRLGEKQIEAALAALRKDMPNSIHVVNTILTGTRWMRERRIEVDFSVYRPIDEGHGSDGDVTVITVMQMPGVVPVVTMHSTDRACRLLRLALRRSAFLPWASDVVFDNTHDGWVTPALLEAVQEHGDASPHTHPNEQMYLPKEEALRLEVRARPDMALRPLDPLKHASLINDLWPHQVRGSLHLLQNLILANQGLMSCGAFPLGEENAPVAWVMTTFYGGVGMLRTADSHRRQGLASLVTRTICKAQAEAGLDPICNVGHYNKASLKMFRDMGFRTAFNAMYLEYKPPRAPSAP